MRTFKHPPAKASTIAACLSLCAVMLGTHGCGGGKSGNVGTVLTPVHVPAYTTIDVSGAGTQALGGVFPVGINAGGSIAGFFIDDANTSHAFVRNPAGLMTTFDLFGAGTGGGMGTSATGINLGGAVIGSLTGPAGTPPQIATRSYLRMPDATLTLVDVPGSSLTVAQSINDAGVIAGYFATANQGHGFIRAVDGSMIVFDPPGAALLPSVFGAEINAGSTIAGSVSDSGSVLHGYLRSPDGTFTLIDAPGAGTMNGTGTQVNALNATGVVVGTVYAPGTRHSFVWTSGNGFTIFDPPGAGSQGSRATCINDSGIVGGNYTDANLVVHGYLRDPVGAFTTIDDPDASQSPNFNGTSVDGINASGAIVGEFFDAAGVRHGFLRE